MTALKLPLKTLVRPATREAASGQIGLILFHGYSSNEEDLFGLAPAVDPRFSVFAPRSPLTVGPGMFGFYQIEYRDNDFIADPEEIEWARNACLDYIRALRSEAGIEADRLVVGGFSQGSIMSVTTLITAPEDVGGIVAMGGRTLKQSQDLMAAPERFSNQPAFVSHGILDDVVRIEFGRETRAVLETLPVRLEYYEYREGHNIGPDNLAAMADWLVRFAEEKSSP